MIEAGNKAPEFSLEDDSGKQRGLQEFLKDGPLILYFYPADFTPGCTREACDIRDLHNEISRVGLKVVGISPQSPESHAKFRDKYQLPFTLLADPDKQAVKLYDVNGPLGFGVRRATFLIDQDGTIQDAVLADLSIGRHKSFIEKAVELRESA